MMEATVQKWLTSAEFTIYFDQTRGERQTKTILLGVILLKLSLNVVCFYNVLTTSLSSPKFSEIVKLKFRGCMVFLSSKKNNCQNCHFVRERVRCVSISQLKRWGLSPPVVQSGITRQDGPGLAGKHANLSKHLCDTVCLWHNIYTAVSLHSLDNASLTSAKVVMYRPCLFSLSID